MNNTQLRLSNYNYDSAALLVRVRELFVRDDKLLGDALIRSVLQEVPGAGKQQVLTRIDILPRDATADGPELLDYGSILFVRETITKGVLLDRLQLLSEKRFEIANYPLASSGMGFQDNYEHSRNSYSDWPCTVFQISFGSVQISYEPLLHPTLKSFSSTYDAIQKFLHLDTFNGQSDGRLGHLLLVVPNCNARIETLALSTRRLDVTVAGVAPPSSLKLTASYKRGKQSDVLEKSLDSYASTFQLAFAPKEIGIWLVSHTGFLADFHSENEHHAQGAKAILPKKSESMSIEIPLTELGELPGLAIHAIPETRRVVILTALSIEYRAVRAHLTNLREHTHRGTIYEEGEFSASDGSLWRAYIAETGPGNSAAARETERAISHFEPEVVLFVGVAGGFKDVAIGDVVAATKLYGYESGKAQREFLPRPQVHVSAYELQQRARAEAKREDWFKRVAARPRKKFKVFVGPVASGDKVLASHRSSFCAFLRKNYGDTLAVEMEGWGFLESVHANADVRALVVRGISDLLDGKAKADAAGSQDSAARHASAFAFEILSKLTRQPAKRNQGTVFDIGRTPELSVDETFQPAAGVQRGFERSDRVDNLIMNVVLGDHQSSVKPALQIVQETDGSGRNALLETLLTYVDSEDQDLLWKALPTIEACAELAPQLFTHGVLAKMANHPDFSVRSSAASICMNFARFASNLVPVDLLIKLSVFSEDWYVERPANAALKALARGMPIVLQVFYQRLRSNEPAERMHAASEIAEIAKREPEILDAERLAEEISILRSKDKKAASVIAAVLPRARKAKRIEGYKYGL